MPPPGGLPLSQVTSPTPTPKSPLRQEQRPSLPVTLFPPTALPQDQFEFALTAVAEEVNAILKALPQ